MPEQKVQVRFVGNFAAILDTPYHFTRYGQLAEMPVELVAQVVRDNDFPLIPAEEFDKIGHSQSELDQFGDPDTWNSATEGFLVRQRAAWKALHDYRATL